MITVSGIGSGLDLESLVTQLVAAEGQPTTLRLNQKEAGLQAELSAFGSLKGALSAFQTELSKLTAIASFQARTVTSSDTGVLTATAAGTSVAGNYNLTVNKLAQSHKLATNAFASSTDPVGTGILTFRFGTYDGSETSFTINPDKGPQSVTIDASSNSLQGIRDAVNNADIGVTATILNDGSGDRLVFTSTDSGAANGLEITTSDDDGNDTDSNGLSQLVFTTTIKNISSTVKGQDADLTVDGLTVTRPSNTITGVIDGVTLNLVASGTATLAVALDKTSVKNAVNSFVSGFNTLVGTLNSLSSFNADTGEAGILLGDVTLRGISSKIRGIISGVVPGLSGTFTSLIDIGIATDSKDGKLVLDNAKLDAAVDSNFDAIAGLFAVAGNLSDPLIKYVGATSKTLAGTYAISVSQLATQGLLNGASAAALTDDGAGNFTLPFVVDANNDTFTIKVDGVQSASITLTQGSYATSTALIAELQSQINNDSALKDNGAAVTVSYDTVADRLVVTSNRYGSGSKVEFTSVDANTASTLGFSVAVGTDGVDVAGTINGVSATGAGRFLTGTIGNSAEGLKVEIVGGSTGSRGSVKFSRGIADRLDSLISAFIDSDGIVDARTDGLNERIDGIANQRTNLDQRLAALETRLRSQFTALDILLGELQNTSNFLTQQLATLPNFSTRTTGR